MDLPRIFGDKFYLECIHLAIQSKGNERYGSLVIDKDQIIGIEYNRAIAHYRIGKLERKIKQGMANHAEIEGMNNAISQGFDLKEKEIFVAGYFPQTGRLFFKNDYTCTKCLPHIRKYGIKNIYVPTPEGWIKKPIDIAEKEAKKFINGTHEKRLKVIIGNFLVSQIDFSKLK